MTIVEILVNKLKILDRNLINVAFIFFFLIWGIIQYFLYKKNILLKTLNILFLLSIIYIIIYIYLYWIPIKAG